MLDIKNIQTFYGKIQALRDVSIKVNTGEIVMSCLVLMVLENQHC